ncbi:MAG: UDP-N-acetylmuramoyl-L-alanine--D-glutamate ligase [Desulfarculus sp.]|nr:UDP-N-acetylmuramoyl-L-alanine--D-glutamate ligase [Desulfarculus sp.]
MNLRHKKVLVVGLGKSGRAVCRLCLGHGALVRATDQSPDIAGTDELRDQGVSLSLGGHRPEDFAWAELIVLSPGVDHRLPEVAQAAARGAEVIGELELGYRFLKAPAVMITGSNGKTTVTTLVAEILTAAGMRVFAGGNLGTPLCELVAGRQEIDWAVLEVSSFQTDTMAQLRPRVGVILNITPDHLDRYASFDDYAASKFRLFANQRHDDLAILCFSDREVARRFYLAPARIWAYAADRQPHPGGWLEGDDLVCDIGDGGQVRLSAANSRLVGGFNRLNLLAAALVAKACGVAPSVIQRVIDGFRGLDHRLQYVASIDGVDYYDDSKGTNVGAVQAALTAIDRPVVLLLGGRDKDGRFADLAPQARGKVVRILCFGEAGPAIHQQVRGLAPAEIAPDLAAAVARARATAAPGQVVLLSPGCASFDAYTGYAQRGDHFQTLVRAEATRG